MFFKEILRRIKTPRKETSFGYEFYTYIVENYLVRFLKTISTPNAKYWDNSIRIEIVFVKKNNTWTLVDFLKEKN